MAPTRAARSERQDRIIRAMVVITLVVVVAGFLIGVATIWQVLGQGSTLDAQAKSDALAGCRSEYAAELAAAEAVVDRAEALQADGTYAAFVAFADGGSRESVAEALGNDDVVTRAIAEARRRRDRIEDERLAAISLSRSDPDEFLEVCERRYG